MKHIALITGASSGLGRMYAQELDRTNTSATPLDELWLIARREDELKQLANSLSTPCRVFALDLCAGTSFDILTSALEEEDELNISWLINAAGFGKFNEFAAMGLRANQNMVRLNCWALISMCYVGLRFMHAGSRIINLASAAAFAPLPWVSTYAASKSFVLSFSQSLNYELASVNIHTTAVCPKFMHTGFLNAPGDEHKVRHYSWIGFEDPLHVVRSSLAAAARGKAVCIPSLEIRLLHGLCKVLPTPLVLRAQDALGNYFENPLN